jgi:hypothetical protein
LSSLEERIVEVGRKLGLGLEAIEKEVRARPERTQLRTLLLRWERKYRVQASEIIRDREKREKEDEAMQAEFRYAKARAESDQHRTKARERMTLGSRLDDVLRQLTMLSEASAGNVARQSPSSDQGIPSLDEISGEVFGRRAFHLVRAAEAELDRRVLGAADKRETTEERNTRLLREYEGFSSWEVSFFEPSMGHPVTVERIRRQHGRRGKDGYPEKLEKAA